jgi:hypothetical protein
MRYFTILFSDKNIEKIKAVIFGSIDNQRPSNDKKYFVASLYEGDTNKYDFMTHLQEYNETEIKEVLQGENWITKLPF